MDYEAVCKLVGQLYLESRHEIENMAKRANKAEQERDAVLRLLPKKDKEKDAAGAG